MEPNLSVYVTIYPIIISTIASLIVNGSNPIDFLVLFALWSILSLAVLLFMFVRNKRTNKGDKASD